MNRITLWSLVLSVTLMHLPVYADEQLAQLPAAVVPAIPALEPATTVYPEIPGTETKLTEKTVRGEKLLNDISESSWVETIDMEKGDITMVSGRSRLLRLQRNIARISVSNPEIVDAVIISQKEVLLNAKAEGAVNVIMWDHLNEVTVFDVTVTKNPNLLQAVLSRIAPDAHFEIFPSNEVFVIKGEVASVAEQKEVEQAASAFAEGSVSLVRVKDAKQILLKIRFVELTHTQGLDFGLDVQYLNRHIGPVLRPGGTGGEIDTASSFQPTGSPVAYNLLSTIPDQSGTHFFPYFSNSRAINTFIKAVEAEGVGKVIARPNLLASDGEEASFLVGGEAAVVAISSTNVGVEYREFGTRLTFTPQILPSGKIRLNVAPEVSSLDFANGVTVSGVTIPSFSTIRTSTVVELNDGETFVIGGLIQQKLTVSDSGIPGLRNLPLIGKLFDNVDHLYSDTELIVIVTPVIVQPEKGLLESGHPLNQMIETATKFMPFPGSDEQSESVETLTKQTALESRAVQTGAAASPLNARMPKEEEWKPQNKMTAVQLAQSALVETPQVKIAPVQLAQAPGIEALDKLRNELQWESLTSVSAASQPVDNVG